MPRVPHATRRQDGLNRVGRLERLASVHVRIADWYAVAGRDLPWRRPDCSPWGVFVSEVMSQQTPLSRVEPAWSDWLERWPTPAALAADSPGEAVRRWGRLGYPRRALRLHEAAAVMVSRHGGAVPGSIEDLLALPGVGPYTAAAVGCFAFGIPSPVIDTNVRRVLVRVLEGREFPAPALTAAERDLAAAALPADPDLANTWNVAAMELGALVCTARAPRCSICPISGDCAWRAAGAPVREGPARTGQSYAGTDRQARGALLAVLRDHHHDEVEVTELLAAWASTRTTDPDQADRALASLIADGLVERTATGGIRLPH